MINATLPIFNPVIPIFAKKNDFDSFKLERIRVK